MDIAAAVGAQLLREIMNHSSMDQTSVPKVLAVGRYYGASLDLAVA